MTTQKRQKMTNKIISVLKTLEPSGDNANTYAEFFGKMSNKEFDDYFREFFADEKANFYVETVEYEREITMETIKKTADLMNVPLFEHVAIPYLSDDPDNVIVTPHPVPVGYIHVKRMPQTLLKKSAGSTKIESRSALTGQVIGADKNSRQSDLETYCLATLSSTQALRELMGPRADNLKAKNEMYNDIAKTGYVSLDDLSMEDSYSKVALNSFNTYYLMQGIHTNLVTGLDTLPGPKK